MCDNFDAAPTGAHRARVPYGGLRLSHRLFRRSAEYHLSHSTLGIFDIAWIIVDPDSMYSHVVSFGVHSVRVHDGGWLGLDSMSRMGAHESQDRLLLTEGRLIPQDGGPTRVRTMLNLGIDH